jgi:hypothetical protein
LAEIEFASEWRNGEHRLEIKTENPQLFEPFYGLILSIADRVQLDGEEVGRAVDDALMVWQGLLRKSTMLSAEKQLGLFGEIWFLNRLIQAQGPKALESWVGPRGQAHDFRIDLNEFEVKSTRAERRIHHISSVTQLVSSPGRALYLISLQFGAAGEGPGESLADRIAAVRLTIRGMDADAVSDFDELLLNGYNLQPESEAWYPDKLILRSLPHLIPVLEDTPCLRPDDILAIPRREMERVQDLSYRLDVTGLGWADGSDEFLSVVPHGSG